MKKRDVTVQKTCSAVKTESVLVILFVVAVDFPCLSVKDNLPSNGFSSYRKHTHQMQLWDDFGLKIGVVVKQQRQQEWLSWEPLYVFHLLA